MKKLILFACALCMSVCAIAQTSFYVYKNDGSSVQFTIADVDSISFTAPTSGTENGHEWEDLGLPSGTKWATCNVGATKPEEYGSYYAWGETSTKSTYDSSTYKWCNGSSSSLTKYNTSSDDGTVDNKTVLELADDAARANWGGAWRMPTDAEWTELRENCTWTWTSNYNGTGVAGRIVTSKTNGNHIFLPAAGYRIYDDLSSVGNYGGYWSSSLYTDSPSNAWFVYFKSDYVGRGGSGRIFGRSVRPVLFGELENGGNSNTGDDTDQNGGNSNTDNSSGSVSASTGTENGYGYVDLGLPSGLKWAACNVGATTLEGYGDYYAWGETFTKHTYNWSTYKWCNGTKDTQTKYCTHSRYGTVDNKTVLELADDAARANWGGAWRMPTDAEWTELRENCTWTWTDDYNGTGVKGQIVTSNTNGNSIFLPAAGYRGGDDLSYAGYYGFYWSSSLDSDIPYSAWFVYFNSDGVSRDSFGRCYGHSVRPVLFGE